MPTFTSVSLISTSSWDDGSGCPIISPCRWNGIVASNIGMMAVHNHTVTAPEAGCITFVASYFPSLDAYHFSPWFPKNNSGWAVENRTNWPGMGCMSTSTLGAVLEYDLFLRAGDWELVFMIGSGSAMGKLSASLNGSAITTYDNYLNIQPEIPTGSFNFAPGGGGAASLTFTIATGVTAGAGRTKLRLQVSGKNTSSSGYIARVGYMRLWRYN